MGGYEGRFTDDFRAGVFCVEYYDEHFMEIESWHLVTTHSVPYFNAKERIEGCISMRLDPLYNNDNIDSIFLSFENAEKYNNSTINTTWIN